MPIKNVISMPYRLAEPIKFRKMPSPLRPDYILEITHHGHSAEYAALVELEDMGFGKAKSADFLREVILETEESSDLFAEIQSINALEAEYATKILEMRKSVRRRLSTLVIDLNTILEAKTIEHCRGHES